MRKIILTAVIIVVVSPWLRRTEVSEPVRSELARLQTTKGLTLAYFTKCVNTVQFNDRSISRANELPGLGGASEGIVSSNGVQIAVVLDAPGMKPFLGIVNSDGSGLRKFPNVATPTHMCWSNDNTALAVTAFRIEKQNGSSEYALQLLTPASENLRVIDSAGFVTSQCWSPEGNQIVYSRDDTVRVFDLRTGAMRVLAKGSDATWSPDGNWLAFRDKDTYYAIRPSGEDRRILFSKKHPLSPSWWSPDSRIVAYISRDGLFEGPFVLDSEMARLRVRRLSDDSEDWIADFSEISLPNFQWITEAKSGVR